MASSTLLVIDDEEIVRHMMARSLRRKGWEVEEADSAHEALRMLTEHPGRYRGIMLDLTMPEMGGLELLERLRPELPTLTVLLVSGHTPDPDMRAMLRGDPHLDYLQKPFTLSILKDTIEAVFGEP